MSSISCVLPGDSIPSTSLPKLKSTSAALKLGPGVRHAPPSDIVAMVAGQLCIDNKKQAVWIESAGGRYVPTAGDLVIAQVHHSTTDSFICTLSPHTSPASLPHLSFASASKKTRPQLAPGSIVYARVAVANKHFEPEIECVNPSTNKSDGLGELKGGMVFDVSLSIARRLMMPEGKGGVVVLEECAERLAFEVAVGRNGKVWVSSKGVRETLAVGKALVTTDTDGLSIDLQRSLVKKLLKGI